MIISRTPYRISLFGGGSDYPQWYREHGGSVLGFAIDKYCYLSVRELPPFFEHKHRIVYSFIELVDKIEEIQHPAVRHILQEFNVEKGLEIHYDGDLPARSGLGSSSSFTIGLIKALYALEGRMISKRALSKKGIYIEQNVIRENVGSQDQVWAAYGGVNRIDFSPDESISVSPIIMSRGRHMELQRSLMLFYTGVSRIADGIAKRKITNLKNRKSHINRMIEMVDEAEGILANPEWSYQDLGKLLHESWMLKRELADGVTTPLIDEAYETARKNGAIGGKVLGAGGGGFLAFLVDPKRREEVAKSLSGLLPVDFGVDTVGSKIVVYEPQGLSES